MNECKAKEVKKRKKICSPKFFQYYIEQSVKMVFLARKERLILFKGSRRADSLGLQKIGQGLRLEE